MARSKSSNSSDGEFFGAGFDEKKLQQIVSRSQPLLKSVTTLARDLSVPQGKALSPSIIDRAVSKALRRLPYSLRVANRRQATNAELKDIRRITTAFLHEQFGSDRPAMPPMDLEFLVRATNFAGLKAQVRDGNFFATLDGEPAIVLFDTKDDEKKSGLAKAVLIIDIVLEVIGLVLGLIGIAAPKPDAEPLVDVMKELLESGAFKTAFEDLLMGLCLKDPIDIFKAILKFLDFLEGQGNLAEIIAHFLAGMGFWDYALTLAKIIAWIIAAIASEGIALIAKIASLVLDVAGIVLKVSDLNKASTV